MPVFRRTTPYLWFLLLAASSRALGGPEPGPIPPRVPERIQDALDAVNSYRRAAGLGSVQLDERMSSACQAHGRYMVANAGHPALDGLKIHRQDPSLKEASPEGAWCGRNADISRLIGSPAAAVHSWMSTLYHRTPILDPRLRRVGIAEAPHPQGGVAAALMFEPERGASQAEDWPVRYPAADQTGVSLFFSPERPNPIPGSKEGGYPITLHFPDDRIANVEAALYDASGTEVPIHLSHPARPAIDFPQGGTICLIPKEPLRASARYRVRISLERQGAQREYSWSFETATPLRVDSRDTQALLRMEKRPIQVYGRVIGAWQKDGRVGLRLQGEEQEEGSWIYLNLDTWNQVAPGRPPEAFLGREVQAVTTPRHDEPAYSLPVFAAWQLGFWALKDLPVLDAKDPGLRGRVGQRLKLRGLITQAATQTDNADFFLQLEAGPVYVFIPRAVWKESLGARSPAQVMGYPIEAESLLKQRGSELHMSVYEPEQLRLKASGELPLFESTDLTSLRQHAGRRIRVRGLITAGGRVSNGNELFIELKTGQPDRTVVLFISPGVWREIAQGKAPEQLRGQSIELEGPPEVTERSVHFSIEEVGQLRLLAQPPLRHLLATQTAALRNAAGQQVLVSGRVSDGDYFEGSQDVYLNLVAGGQRSGSVFLDVDAALWKQLAGEAVPDTFKGRQIEARVIPQPSEGELRLQVVDKDSLQFLKSRASVDRRSGARSGLQR